MWVVGLSIRGKACRGQIAQAAVGPSVIVVLAVILDDHARFAQGPELLSIQAFVTEPAAEAFHETVLPGVARVDVNGFNVVLGQPALDLFGNELLVRCRCADKLVHRVP